MNGASPVIDPVENAPAGDAFYTPTSPLPGGTPGDPVHSRRLDNNVAALESGENRLVLYRSQDVRGKAVSTSGIIVLPDRDEHPVPVGGFPLITWAHGTVGVANSVAPSRDRSDTGASPMNAYPNGLLNSFLRRGWAVAMTDYEALGTGTEEHLHPYLLGASEANGVLDIVLTARRLFRGAIGEEYAIVGHSQGGQAALFAAHHAPERVESGLVGVAAIAPSNHSLGLVRLGAKDAKTGEGFAFTPLFLAGAIGGEPSIVPAQVLSDAAFDLWPQVRHLSRAELSDPLSWGGIKGNAQFRGTYPDGPNDHQQLFDQELARMNPDVEIKVPVRITQSDDDKRVFASFPALLKGTNDLVDELNETNKKHGIEVEYQHYTKGQVVPKDEPLGAHFTTINHDADALIDWIGRLFTRP
ncbi:alpha/beta hydrolase [Streptomyces sp. RKAG293]|uniref:lipase family protein n=1 Tax=Streptomyces sp. RKAG293 TaxID=2893403 RepID=UPI0020334ACE|nr:alpha/beta hydrolase [Streptomyces sp. RKAG293]MCM2416824.1 lipase family protein [Streptomyces sp. RKAG293]